jgi:hypothetical protein
MGIDFQFSESVRAYTTLVAFPLTRLTCICINKDFLKVGFHGSEKFSKDRHRCCRRIGCGRECTKHSALPRRPAA